MAFADEQALPNRFCDTIEEFRKDRWNNHLVQAYAYLRFIEPQLRLNERERIELNDGIDAISRTIASMNGECGSQTWSEDKDFLLNLGININRTIEAG